jgi:hypothetical protein
MTTLTDSFIDERAIEETLNAAAAPDRGRVRDILAKASMLAGLNAGDVARTSTLTLFAMRQAPPMSHTGEEERIRAAAAAARCDVKKIVIDANVFARVELKTAEAPGPAN